jgi:hypothetical protein
MSEKPSHATVPLNYDVLLLLANVISARLVCTGNLARRAETQYDVLLLLDH